MEQKGMGFQQIITVNESWFFLYFSRDSVWVASFDELPQRIKQKIDRRKCLVSILWSVNGIRSLLDVPKRTTCNTAFCADAALPSLNENVRSRNHRKTLKGRLIHMDNGRPYNSGRAQRCIEISRAKCLPYPAHSQYLIPSDFVLLDRSKETI
jgi:hypothetical protein